jgi:hypothetical protein
MKIASIPFVVAILFSTLVSLPAQSNAPAENAANQSVAAAVNAQASNSIAATGSNYGNTGIPIGSENPAGKKLLGLGVHISGTSDKNEAEDIVAIVGAFVMILTIVTLYLYARDRRSKRLHETLRAMIDKGVPIPPGFFGVPPGFSGIYPGIDLRSGLILAGMGIGFILMGGKVGYILLFMGVALLIVWLVERKNKNGDQPPKP